MAIKEELISFKSLLIPFKANPERQEEVLDTPEKRQDLKCVKASCSGLVCEICLFHEDNIKEFVEWEYAVKKT